MKPSKALIAAAKKITRKTEEDRYIIWDGTHFRIASREDLDTFYYGIEPYMIVEA